MANQSAPIIRRLLSAEVAGHPAVWSLVTGIFILLGYIWLQQFAAPYASRLSSEADLVGQTQSSKWNPEIYRDIETLESMDITDQQDDPRAVEYRRIIELEEKIAPLLKKASRLMAESKFAATEGDEHAWAVYQQILAIDPSNTTAKLGSNEIIATLQGRVEESIAQRAYDDSEKWLAQLDLIQPNALYQQQQRQQITAQIQADLDEKERQQAERERLTRLSTALDQAHAVFNAANPEPRAAYDLYSLALDIDPNNPTALSGIRQIKRYYAKKVNTSVANKDFDAAKQALQRLKDINGDQADIRTLSLMLANGEAASRAKIIAEAIDSELERLEF